MSPTGGGRGAGRPARRPGRPPGSGNTREAVLAAARAVFAERGFDGASLRVIASAAGVDPGMVRHFFGDKEGLFRAASRIPFDPAEAIPSLLAAGLDGLGERIVRFFVSAWEAGPAPFAAMLRGATSHERSAAMLREFVTHAVVGRVAAALDRPNPALRAALVGSQLVGLGMVRYILRVEPLASVPADTVVAALGPTVQRYLTGDLD
ncbi:MAG TPA: TetR family transcriptional regulator [Mycobacteriales bacterium]|nr:TetR family transcriptional regulator [Mycobacteriales bacterium]